MRARKAPSTQGILSRKVRSADPRSHLPFSSRNDESPRNEVSSRPSVIRSHASANQHATIRFGLETIYLYNTFDQTTKTCQVQPNLSRKTNDGRFYA